MTNVLIIGATGYIGHPLTQSLLRSGDYRVFGLARTAEKANLLARDEVTPIIGDISSAETLTSAIAQHHINVVVDVAGANKESYSLLALLRSIGAKRQEAALSANVKIPKLGFIYCSGMWVHGSSTSPVNDLMPVGVLNAPTPPVELTNWRPALEQAILAASDVLDVLVIRPALVYGRSGAIWTSLFEPIYNAMKNNSPTATVEADPESHPGLIHVDDVASGFHAAIDNLPLIAGTGIYPIFDLVTSKESMRDVLVGVGQAMGYRGKVELDGYGDNAFMKAMSTSCNGSSARAKKLLGWEPSRIGLLANVDIFAGAWVAAKL